MLTRPMVHAGGLARVAAPGDTLAAGESISAGAISTAGAGTLTGAAIATGIIRRTGPGAGYTDTTDTAQNIITALAGNNAAADVLPGSSFRLLFINTVAFAMTFAAGTGVVSGTGTLGVAASSVREYLVTVENATPQTIVAGDTTNASTAVTFDESQDMGDITPGMVVSGTGITAGTKVAGITQDGGGKISGVTLDTAATANGSSVQLTFSPAVRFDSLLLGTL